MISLSQKWGSIPYFPGSHKWKNHYKSTIFDKINTLIVDWEDYDQLFPNGDSQSKLWDAKFTKKVLNNASSLKSNWLDLIPVKMDLDEGMTYDAWTNLVHVYFQENLD
jgi:hypothetical protein